jgi:ketosteroid isomerase-like protein
MSNVAIVRKYLEEFFSGKTQHSKVREWLTDDFTLRDPLMSADSADDYVRQLTAFGDEMDLRAELREIVGEGNRVAALVDFQTPAGPVRYAQWFEFRDGKIAGLEVFYDPRPFLRAAPEGSGS